MGRVLSLFDRTGAWADPYRERGDVVECVDLSRGDDVRLIEYPGPDRADVVLAAPPCTEFAGSGARWWKEKGDTPLLEGLSMVDAALRIIRNHQPSVWAIENPVGRLRRYLGPPAWSFDPHEFAGWSDNPDAEAYTKRTLLWGEFAIPEKRAVEPALGSLLHRLPPSQDRSDLRSITPQGFARAFAEANPALESEKEVA